MSKNTANINLDNIRDNLRDIRGQTENYHNHKENMAWVAAATFLVTAIGMGGFVFEKTLPMVLNVLFCSLVLIAYFLGLFFVRVQLRAKNYASDTVGACNRLLFRIQTLELPDEPVSFPDNESLPQFLKDEIVRYGQARRANREGLKDSVKYMIASQNHGPSFGAAARAWRDLVDHEKQEIILTVTMTVTAVVTIVGVLFPTDLALESSCL